MLKTKATRKEKGIRYEERNNSDQWLTEGVRIDDPAVQRPLRQTHTSKSFAESQSRDERCILPSRLWRNLRKC